MYPKGWIIAIQSRNGSQTDNGKVMAGQLGVPRNLKNKQQRGLKHLVREEFSLYT
jgi:hypothetical protein